MKMTIAFIAFIAFLFCIMVLMVLGAAFAYGDASETSMIQVPMLNQDPNPARAGDTVDLRFKIQNSGGQSVKNIDVELVQDYPFTIASGEAVKSIGSLDAYQNGNKYATLEYLVKIDKDAAEGQRQVQLKYKLSDGVWTAMSFSVNIMSKQFAQIIYVDKARLEPGKETNMTFTITNLGNAPLQNLLFSWQEPNGVILPVHSGDIKYVKYLDIGQSVDLTYQVIADVNAKPGLYQLNLNLKSESFTNSSSAIIMTRAGVFIGGETDFDVVFSESSQGQTSLSVSNTGNNPAQSVSVKIPPQQSFRVTGSNSAIIGNLDKGDYTIVSFQIASMAANFSGQSQRQPPRQDTSLQNGNRTGMGFSRLGNGSDSNLRVVIDYTDTTGERRSVEKSVPIQFRAATGQQGAYGSGMRAQQASGFLGSTTFYVIIGIVIIACLLVFRHRIFGKRK